MTNWIDKQCKFTEWRTPPHILDCVRSYFAFRGQACIPLDAATTKDNPTKASVFLTKEDDALNQTWGIPTFVNPPYGKDLPKWTAKIRQECEYGTIIVALLPCGARFSTRYWQNDILTDYLDCVCFVKGRVAFLNEQNQPVNGNMYDSAIYAFNAYPIRFLEAFRPLGKTVAMVH